MPAAGAAHLLGDRLAERQGKVEVGRPIGRSTGAVENSLRPIEELLSRHRPPSHAWAPAPNCSSSDEADRLRAAGLEQPRDIHDPLGIGLIQIGMPGLNDGSPLPATPQTRPT